MPYLGIDTADDFVYYVYTIIDRFSHRFYASKIKFVDGCGRLYNDDRENTILYEIAIYN